MMAMVVSNVIARYLFRSPMHSTEEITEFMMVALVYFTLAHTQALRAHISVDFLVSRYSVKAKLICEILMYILGVLFFLLISWQSGLAAVHAWNIKEITFGVMPLPLFPAKFLVSLGSFILSIRLILDIINDFANLGRKGQQ